MPTTGLAINNATLLDQVSFFYFKTSPEIIQLAAMLYIGFLLSMRDVEDSLKECGVKLNLKFVWYWWHKFVSHLESEIKNGAVKLPRASIGSLSGYG